ncbi:MAG TPA: hypothetical protein VII98_09165, partial [Solirubrobacteraceae bacterium]
LATDRVLPGSTAPRIVEARDSLEAGLRAAVMERRDPELLAAWCRTAAGQEDEPAAQALLERLSPGDSRIPAARARLARLRSLFAT